MSSCGFRRAGSSAGCPAPLTSGCATPWRPPHSVVAATCRARLVRQKNMNQHGVVVWSMNRWLLLEGGCYCAPAVRKPPWRGLGGVTQPGHGTGLGDELGCPVRHCPHRRGELREAPHRAAIAGRHHQAAIRPQICRKWVCGFSVIR